MSKKSKEGPINITPEDLLIDAPETFLPEENGEEEESEDEGQEQEEPEKTEPKKYVARAKRPVLNADGSLHEGPTARLHREDGKLLKRIAINFQGLSDEMLPPITKRKFAHYEIIGKGEPDPLSGEMIETVPLILPGTFVIYDPFNKDVLARHKTLKNVIQFENQIINGMNVPKETIGPIIFNDGFLSVPIEKQYKLYVLLELHPLNASNRWRDKSQPAAFRRTDIDKRKWGESAIGMDLAYEAETSVVNMRNGDDIIAYAHAAGIPTAGRMTDNGENSIKTDLRRFARSNPKDFFKLNKNNEAAVKISVLDATELGLIDYHVDKRAWDFSTDGERIGQHLPGEEPTQALVKLFLKQEYSDKYAKLQNQLNYWDQ